MILLTIIPLFVLVYKQSLYVVIVFKLPFYGNDFFIGMSFHTMYYVLGGLKDGVSITNYI